MGVDLGPTIIIAVISILIGVGCYFLVKQMSDWDENQQKMVTGWSDWPDDDIELVFQSEDVGPIELRFYLTGNKHDREEMVKFLLSNTLVREEPEEL